MTLSNIIWWLILALLLGWLVLLAAVVLLVWPMLAATAIQQAVSDSPTSTMFEVTMLAPEIAWLAVLVRWGIRRRQRPARHAEAAPEPVPTAWRPWS